jgi:bifunctional polynucleotide phosphatase/kinase
MKRVNKGTIKWINALDTVLVGKTLGKETGRTKIAAFDLVISNMILCCLKTSTFL